MSEAPEPNLSEEKSAIPIPYSVMCVGWVVSLIGASALAPPLIPLVGLAGPALMAAKFLKDGERFAKIKDNPKPIVYNFHAPGVYAQIDQALKTLPGYFENISSKSEFENLSPKSGEPLHTEVTITLRHPDVKKSQVPESKQNDMKSTIYMTVDLKPVGNKTEMTIKFIMRPLVSRLPLERVTDHLMATIDELVKKHAK